MSKEQEEQKQKICRHCLEKLPIGNFDILSYRNKLKKACRICIELERDQKIKSNNKNKKNKNIKCQKCTGDYFINLEELYRHIKIYHNNDRELAEVHCTFCEKVFKSIVKLNKHLVIMHKNPPKHFCKNCNYKTHLHDHFEQHIRGRH
jgi:hypothetical protein